MNTSLIQNHRPQLEEVEPPESLSYQETNFALNIFQGHVRVEAYRLAFGGKCASLDGTQISRAAYKLYQKPAIKKYLRALSKELERAAVATALDLQMFLSAAVFTPVGQIDENHMLCQSVKRSTTFANDGSMIENEEIKAVSKIESAKTLIRMKGYDAPLKVDMNVKAGVMVVPMATNVDDWAKAAADSQKKLMEDAIDV